MGDYDKTAAEMYRRRVFAARKLTDKMPTGPRLFEYACTIAKDGIRRQLGTDDEDEIRRELRRRLGLARRLER